MSSAEIFPSTLCVLQLLCHANKHETVTELPITVALLNGGSGKIGTAYE